MSEGLYTHELGFFGNIWVKSHILANKNDTNGGGHTHKFDHVTLVVKGSVMVEVEGFSPKIFRAPQFIVIKKEHKHKFTALEDDTLYYCVFALRDANGEVTDLYDPDNSPYWSGTKIDPNAATKEQLEALDKNTTDDS